MNPLKEQKTLPCPSSVLNLISPADHFHTVLGAEGSSFEK